MIEGEVQFQSPLLSGIGRPWKHFRTQSDVRGIDAQQWILKLELRLPVQVLHTKLIQRLEHVFIQLPIPVPVGIGQRRFCRYLNSQLR